MISTAAKKPHRWTALVQGDRCDRIDARIEEIAAALRSPQADRSVPNPDLGGGDAGVALFFHYLDRTRPGSGYADVAQAYLDRAFASVADSNLGFDLYGGITGVAWVHQHCYGSRDGAAVLEDVDRSLVRLLATEKRPLLYDLIAGLAGIGVYALERWPHGAAPEILASVVRHLLGALKPVETGSTLFTPPRLLMDQDLDYHPQGYFNMGAAHGVPAVTAVLARAASRGVGGDEALEGVQSTAAWILANRFDRKDGPRFPRVIDVNGHKAPARLAWCYGDAGVSGTLLCAAQTLGDGGLLAKAKEAALEAALVPEDLACVRDAPICHGAVGLAHIFNRFYQATGEDAFARRATFWLEKAVDYYTPGQGIGGFRRMDLDDWQDAPGFLEGSAGIGLVLLAATCGDAPDWDRVLVLS